MAHSFPAARLIAVLYIAKWAYAESRGLFGRLTEGNKVSLTLSYYMILLFLFFSIVILPLIIQIQVT